MPNLVTMKSLAKSPLKIHKTKLLQLNSKLIKVTYKKPLKLALKPSLNYPHYKPPILPSSKSVVQWTPPKKP